MNKKEYLIPFLFIGLSLTFLVVSGMVYLSNGKSKKWVARKMKIGGLLLALSAFQNMSFSQEIQPTCYKVAPDNDMRINGFTQEGLKIDLSKTNIILGYVAQRQSDELSFCVADSSGQIFQKGSILPVDGKFDQTRQDFKIELDQNLKDGKYILMLFAISVNQQDLKKHYLQYNLIIKHE
jgi:hypothetical protein